MNVLVLILTSSKINLLKRAIKSVKNQYSVKLFSYDLKIVVNTLNDKYYKEVLDNIKDKKIEIIRTESNGKPGKGHNSCLELFKKRKMYSHLAMLDGDDLYYPCAFQQFEKMLLKEPKLDLVHLLINDRVNYSNPNNFNSKPLKNNLQLISSFRQNKNWWKYTNVKNPLKERIEDTKTPSRIILASRNIFKTTYPIRYSEKLDLYDDMVAFVSFYDAQLKGEINTFSTSESNIYCYNALNDNSVSYKFKNKDRENKVFREETFIFKNVIKHNWNLKELPFISVEQPDNFTTEDKIIFCNKEVVDFEIKSKYNELELYSKEEIKKTDIKKIEKIENLFHLLINFGFDTKNNYSKKIELSLLKNDVNSYLINLIKLSEKYPNVSVYKKLFNIFFSLKQYEKAEYYYNLIKIYDELDNEIINNYKIIEKSKYIVNNNIYYKNNKFQIKMDETKKIFCYFTGYTGEFNGKNYGEKNVYGSEISAIKLCEELTNKYNVIILCNTNKPLYHKNVLYLNYRNLLELNNEYTINYLVISRYIGYILDVDLSKVENIYYIMHDARIHDVWRNDNLPLISSYVFKNFQNKIKKMIFVSKWQKENFLKTYNISNIKIEENKYKIINNGINTELFKYNKVEKKNNRFIYCSDPERGLEMLCEILIELQKEYTDITLDIYFGNLPNKFKKYIDNYKWINFHGKIPNEQITKEFSKSDFWLYPNMNSHETFCISCLEAMCGGNVIITRDYSALPELVKDCGLLVPKELEGYGFKKYVIDKIKYILENNLKKEYQEKSYKESLKYDWKNISNFWIKMLENN